MIQKPLLISFFSLLCLYTSAQNNSSKSILLVGGYTEKMGWVEGMAKGIGVYEFDSLSGKLNLLSTSAYVKNPSFLTVHPNKEYVYAVSETENPTGNVLAYHYNANNNSLEYINSVSSQGTDPCFISIDKTGKFALVANYGNGSVATMSINADGSLSESTTVHQHTGKGPAPQQTNAHAHNIISSANNKYVYSNDLGSDQIYQYQFNAPQGQLIPTNNNTHTEAGAGPRQLTFHSSLNIAYAINELNGTINTFSINILSGKLEPIQTISTVEKDGTLPASGADIHINPSGKFLYASNRAKHNNIAIYSINQQTGILTLIGHHSTLGKTPRYFTFDPSGKFILIANQDSNNIVVFKIDQSTGLFIEPGIINEIPTPTCIVFL